jgi:hypothetical protein
MRTSRATFVALFLCVVAAASANAADQPTAGVEKNIQIPVKIGALDVQFPAKVRLRMKSAADSTFEINLAVVADVARLYDETTELSAAALNRAPKCDYGIDVREASLTRLDDLNLSYSISLKYTQPVCAGGVVILRPSVGLRCEATGRVSYSNGIVSVAPKPKEAELCERHRVGNDLESAAVQALRVELLERYDLDLSKSLPEPFNGLAIDIKSLVFSDDKKLLVELASVLTAEQFDTLIVKFAGAAS